MPRVARLPRINPDPDGEHRLRRGIGRRRRRSKLRWTLLIGLLALAFGPSLAVRMLNPPFTSFMLARHFENLASSRGAVPLAQRWVPLQAISAELALAVIAGEDQRFPAHHGFDFAEVAKALEDAEAGSLRGASTLSQQTAKNLFLWSGRSWLRKGLEAWYTFWLEILCGKRRILELYLNIAEFGPDVYGAEAAAQRYFRKPARALNRNEAALLAAVLPAPRTRQVLKPSAEVRARQGWVLRQMAQLGGTNYLRGIR